MKSRLNDKPIPEFFKPIFENVIKPIRSGNKL